MFKFAALSVTSLLLLPLTAYGQEFDIMFSSSIGVVDSSDGCGEEFMDPDDPNYEGDLALGRFTIDLSDANDISGDSDVGVFCFPCNKVSTASITPVDLDIVNDRETTFSDNSLGAQCLSDPNWVGHHCLNSNPRPEFYISCVDSVSVLEVKIPVMHNDDDCNYEAVLTLRCRNDDGNCLGLDPNDPDDPNSVDIATLCSDVERIWKLRSCPTSTCQSAEVSGTGSNTVNVMDGNVDTDTDGDYTHDDVDNCDNTDNYLQLNEDSDDYGNQCDNCRLEANNSQTDTNEDNIGDACQCEDTDEDGDIDGVDVGAAFQCISDPNSYDLSIVDADDDGDCTSADVLATSQVVNGWKNSWELKCERRPYGDNPDW